MLGVVPRQITLGSANPAKREQLRWLIEGLPLEAVSVEPIAVLERASDLAGNAAAKALAYSAGGLAIASDGGLEVPALGRRWDPLLTGRRGQAGLQQLTQTLTGREVRWIEAVAIAERGRLLASWTETGTEGMLRPQPWPRPRDFWVWDIFSFPALGKTWAELDEAERAQVDLTWVRLKQRVADYFRAG
jgi:inosine/xanthosine triphosphate pyrophosphatase family protein